MSPFLHMMEWKHFLTLVHWRVGVAVQRHLVILVWEELNEVAQSQVENPVSGMEQSHALILAGDCLVESSFAKNDLMVLVSSSSFELDKFTLWKKVSSPTMGCRTLARGQELFSLYSMFLKLPLESSVPVWLYWYNGHWYTGVSPVKGGQALDQLL